LAVWLQRKFIQDHQAQGGKLASIWWAVGISLLVSLFVLFAFLGVLLTLPESWLPAE
jgi:hypothetical protein